MAHIEMQKVQTFEAPKPRGPYSQAVQAGSYLFVAGQIPLNPKTEKLVEGSIQEQTRQVIANIEAILAAKNLSLKNVVKAEVYLKDLNDFTAMNAIYSEKFSHEIKPARVTIQVSRLPMDSLIEISCIAWIPDDLIMEK